MELPVKPDLQFDNLKALKILGKGAMGTVFLVHDVTSDPFARFPFALKVVDKLPLHTKLDADRRARWEIRVLARFSNTGLNPFLPHLLGSFETDDLLAWAVPYCSGGDLNVLRYRQNDHVFSSAVIRFYLAEIICAIEHLHGLGIVYRDLKPENILVQESGHVTLTDFDLSRNLSKNAGVRPRIPDSDQNRTQNSQNPHEVRRKHRRNFTRWFQGVPDNKKGKSARVSPVSRRKPSFTNGERSNSFVGTEEYISPEVVRGTGHEFAVDWWALGVLTYEMMYGKTPFKGKNRKETFRNVLVKEPEFIGKPTPLTDLIGKLLEKDPTMRLGYYRGAREIKEHVFFQGVKWDLLTEVSRPPIIPSREEEEPAANKKSSVVDVREYFKKLRSPPSMPPSPSSDCTRNISFTEY